VPPGATFLVPEAPFSAGFRSVQPPAATAGEFENRRTRKGTRGSNPFSSAEVNRQHRRAGARGRAPSWARPSCRIRPRLHAVPGAPPTSWARRSRLVGGRLPRLSCPPHGGRAGRSRVTLVFLAREGRGPAAGRTRPCRGRTARLQRHLRPHRRLHGDPSRRRDPTLRREPDTDIMARPSARDVAPTPWPIDRAGPARGGARRRGPSCGTRRRPTARRRRRRGALGAAR
jgi:hypothetical protein